MTNSRPAYLGVTRRLTLARLIRRLPRASWRSLVLAKIHVLWIAFVLWLIDGVVANPLMKVPLAIALVVLYSLWPMHDWWWRLRLRRHRGQPRWQQLNNDSSLAVEVDLPCSRCGEANVGVENGLWNGEGSSRYFRTCESCGHTDWWPVNDRPPLVPRRRRPFKPQRPRRKCPDCGYSFDGLPLAESSRGSETTAYVQTCPECGRSEVVHPASPPASASTRTG